MLPNHAPHFGRYWAQAASGVADVVTVEFVHTLTLPARSRDIASDGTRYQVRRFDLRPTRVFSKVSSRVLAQRVQRALDLASSDHGAIDLLHTHYYHQTHYIPYLSKPVPYVHTEHSAALLRGSLGDRAHYPLSPAGLAKAAQGLGGAARVIAVSACLADSMERLGLPGSPYVVIPNPVDTAVFRHRPELPRSPKLVVSVGRLSEDKQPLILLEAFAIARKADPDLHWEVVGDGPVREQMVQRVAELGIEPAVTFRGRLPHDELADVLARASVFTNASKIETFALAMAEALASGTPVVAPDVAALPELVTEQNGILVEPDDPNALADGMLRSLGRDHDHAAIAEQARQRFSHEAVASQLARVYEDALS